MKFKTSEFISSSLPTWQEVVIMTDFVVPWDWSDVLYYFLTYEKF